MDIVLKQEVLKRRCYKLRHFFGIGTALSQLWKRLPFGSYILKMHFDAVNRPSYAFGVYSACIQAKALGFSKVSVIEFGVAGGNGLVALEEAATQIGQTMDIDVEIFGFDIVSGLPETSDYRDLIYWFQPKSFDLDEQKLRSQLKRAKLVLGDIKNTVGSFLDSFKHGPIGFCSFDLDYYSSTKAALDVFEGGSNTRLPRVLCYFDDTVGISDLNIHCNKVGQLLAIDEFNRGSEMYIGPIHKLRNKRPIKADWNEQMYALHDFKHPLYNKLVNPFDPDQATRSARLR